MSSIHDFTLYELGFQSEAKLCCLRFSLRQNGQKRCRLILNERCTKIVRGWGNNTITVRVNDVGDILLTHGKSLTLGGDNVAWVSLDRYANQLSDAMDDVPYECMPFCNGSKILLTRSEHN